MNHALLKLAEHAPPPQELGMGASGELLLPAVLIGVYLMGLTLWAGAAVDKKPEKDPGDQIIRASSVLFLTVGIAGVMILVSNSLARAFAIGAAIALVRFRVKVEGKFIGMALLYAVICGMACGVDRLDVAWALALVFGGTLGGVLALRWWAVKRSERCPGSLVRGEAASIPTPAD